MNKFSSSSLALILTFLALPYSHSFHTFSSRAIPILNDDIKLSPFLSSKYPHVRSFFESSSRLWENTMKEGNNGKTENDEFEDDFDPLMSPHAYSKGSSSRNEVTKSRGEEVEEFKPLQMKSVKEDFRGASEQDYKTEQSYFTMDWSVSPNSAQLSSSELTDISNNDNDDNFEFDPLLSPHSYPNGSSSKPILKSKDPPLTTPPSRIGVLLIDHGSVRSSSNERLEEIAALYQSRAGPNIIVKASHMEISKPSIEDGIRELWLEQHVSKIICHPYFLSPGRHVREDIPHLIHSAVMEMNGEEKNEEGGSGLYLGDGENLVRVVMTDPVGSNLDRMVNIIDEMVEAQLDEHEVIRRPNVTNEKKELSGFFGEIQRMMDEQL